jgi:hypothetical protein
MPRLVLAPALALALAGCGGAGGPQEVDRPPAGEAPPANPLATPAGVPQRATGPADAASAQVVRRWLTALSDGDVERAARLWALPARFQNGTPVLTVDSPAERVAVNAALPCGGRVARIGGAGRFTVVAIRLTRRPGADCGAGVGGSVRATILARGGRIHALYRLYDRGEAPPAPGTPATSV